MYFDYTYILVIIGAIISLIASANVKKAYKKYSKVTNSKGLTSQEVADRILFNSGITNVTINRVGGELTDYYSPTKNSLALSDNVFGSTSVAAISIAAHECGHAIQQKEGYGPLKIRTAAVPMVNIGSKISIPLILIGLLLDFMGLAKVGIVLFLIVVFFQLITLPVEFNASKRALVALTDGGFLDNSEIEGSKKVLNAAALTYVAALFTSIMQLVRLILIVKGGSRRK